MLFYLVTSSIEFHNIPFYGTLYEPEQESRKRRPSKQTHVNAQSCYSLCC